MATTPEARARINIDAQLKACGWVVQNQGETNLHAGLGVAVREYGAINYLSYMMMNLKLVNHLWTSAQPGTMRFGKLRSCFEIYSNSWHSIIYTITKIYSIQLNN